MGVRAQGPRDQAARAPPDEPNEGIMKVFNRSITGEEGPTGGGSALDALIAFDHAFNHANLDGLAENGAPGDLPSMNDLRARLGVAR